MLLMPAMGMRGADSSVRLRVGDALPPIAGRTLSEGSLTLPAPGAVSVLMFGFSRTAGDDSDRWGRALAKADPGLAVYSVIELEPVPSLLRGMVRSSIAKSMPEIERRRSVVLLQDDKLWRARLGVKDADRAYVLLIDGKGRVAWESGQAFQAGDAERLDALAKGLM